MRAFPTVLALLATVAVVSFAQSGPFVYPGNVNSLNGRRKGSTSWQCAATVQYIMRPAGKPVPHTTRWRAGAHVRTTSVPSGTVISTFLNNPSTNDPYNNVYGRHVGWYLDKSSSQVRMVHTWGGPTHISIGNLRYDKRDRFHMNGNHYFVTLSTSNSNRPSYNVITVRGLRSGTSRTFWVFRGVNDNPPAATMSSNGGEGSTPPRTPPRSPWSSPPRTPPRSPWSRSPPSSPPRSCFFCRRSPPSRSSSASVYATGTTVLMALAAVLLL